MTIDGLVPRSAAGASDTSHTALTDQLADELAGFRRVATLAPPPSAPYQSWLAAGRGLLDATRGLVAVRDAQGRLVVEGIEGDGGGLRGGDVIDDARIDRAIDQGVTVATLGGQSSSDGRADLGPDPVVIAPIWSDGSAVGAVVFQSAGRQVPHAALDLALIDLCADGVGRVYERGQRPIGGLVGVADPWDLLPDVVVRLDAEGHQIDARGVAAHGVFDPCAKVRRADDAADSATALAVRSAVSGALRSGAVRTVHFSTSTRRDGRQVEARFVPAGDDQVLCVVRDVTDRHRLEQSLVEQVSFATLLSSIATRLLCTPDESLDEGIVLALREIARFTNADGAALYEQDAGATAFHRTHTWGDDGGSGSALLGDDAAEWLATRFALAPFVVLGGAAAVVDPPPPAILTGAPGDGVLWLRLGHPDAPTGGVLLRWTGDHPGEPAGITGMSEAGASVFEGAIQRRRVAALGLDYSSVAEAIARNDDLSSVLEQVADLVARHTLGAAVAVLLVEANGFTLAAGGQPGWRSWFQALPVDLTSPYGQVAATGQPVLVADATREPRFRGRTVPVDGYRAVQVLPIHTGSGHDVPALLVVLGGSASGVMPRDPVRTSAVSLISIAMERVADQDRLAYQATHDPLTGVGNRAALNDRLTGALERARHSGRRVGLLYCDLDGFKEVNDRHGHDHGDRLLVEVAARVRRAVRPEDLVARTGGDEFVVVCEDLDSVDQAAVIAEQVHAMVEDVPVDLGDLLYSVEMSVGVALADPVLDDPDRLLRAADLAMYQAKSQARGDDGTGRAASRTRSRFTVDLVRAISSDELDVHYQGVVDRRGFLVSVDALLRWPDSGLGDVAPDRVARAAAESGYAAALGRWFRRKTLSDRALLAAEVEGRHDADTPPIELAVSAADLLSMGFEVGLLEDLHEYGTSPEALVLRVQAADLRRSDVRNVVRTVADQGLAVTVDGFGSASLSLTDLARMPLAGARFGSEVVGQVTDDRAFAEVVRSLTSLCKGVGWRSQAAGVTSDREASMLLELGVERIQGPLVGDPLPIDAFARWLGGHTGD
jgi:diguanylate cyclase (GGDEF)-like protein